MGTAQGQVGCFGNRYRASHRWHFHSSGSQNPVLDTRSCPLPGTGGPGGPQEGSEPRSQRSSSQPWQSPTWSSSPRWNFSGFTSATRGPTQPLEGGAGDALGAAPEVAGMPERVRNSCTPTLPGSTRPKQG